MALPTPPNNTQPIPNNPFYYPETYYIQGAYGPLVVGSGLTINYATGTISSSGGGGGGAVNSVTGTAPITVTGTVADPVVGVTAASTTALGVVELATNAEVAAGTDTTRAITPSSLASSYMPKSGGTFTGPVIFGATTTHNATALFTVGTTTCGTALFCGAVTTCAAVTNNGTVTNCGALVNCGTVTNHNTTTHIGAVTSCSTTTNIGALTNCALVKNCADVCNFGTVYDIGAHVSCGNLTVCGTAGFCNTSTFAQAVTLCCTPIMATGIPLGCAACITYSNTTSGLTATNVQAAIDELDVAAGGGIPCSCLTAKGQILSSNGSAPTALAVGSDGQSLVADSSCALGLKWASSTTPIATTSVTGVVCIGSNISVTGAGQISVPVATTSVNGVVCVGSNISVTSGQISVADATNSTAGVIKGCTNNTICNVALGGSALGSSGTGAGNTAIGCNALGGAFSNCCSTAIGLNAACGSVNGNGFVVIGAAAMTTDIGGTNNVAIGNGALQTASGTNNLVAIGKDVGLQANSACNSVFIGGNAGFNTRAACNVLIGYQAAFCFGKAPLTGISNVGVGTNVLACLTGATCGNTAIGDCAAAILSTGACNVALGYQAGGLTTGSRNVIIGPQVAPAGGGAASCQLAIGFANGDNWITGDSTKNIKPGAGIVDSTNSSGTTNQILSSTGANSLNWTNSVPTVDVPSAPAAAGTTGEIAFDTTYFYFYAGTRWQRIAWDSSWT